MKIVLLLATLNSLTGIWIGTLHMGEVPAPVRLEIISEERGTLSVPFEGISEEPVSIRTAEPSHLQFELKQEKMSLLFDGKVQQNSIQGKVTSGNQKGTFELVRTVAVDVRKYFGSYEFESGQFLHIRTWDELGENQLTYLDEKGQVGPLHAISDTEFFSGPGLWIPVPGQKRIIFEKNAKGKITGLVWSKENVSQKAAKRETLYQEEEIKFTSGKTQLSGSLVLPSGKGPFPAVVLVHGSGPVTRDFFGPIAYLFSRRGIAVLSYDKRGTGGSEGHWMDASFTDYASDAIAGVHYLSTRKEINPKAIGLWGASQAGWIIPQAMEREENIAFAVLLSVPSVTPFEQELQRTSEEMKATGATDEQIAKAKDQLKGEIDSLRTEDTKAYLRLEMEKLQKEANQKVLDSSGPANPRFLLWYSSLLDYDPVPSLEKVKRPVLVLYGELDRGVPLTPNKTILENAFKKAGNDKATVRVFPKGNHALLLSETGSMAEFPRLTQFVPGLFDIMVDWILNAKTRRREDAKTN